MTAEFNCIAIETATNHCSVAACAGARAHIVKLEDPRTSSRRLYQALEEVMTAAGLQPESLDCVAFGCGPGSFTGVRVAAAAAQGIAYARSLPVCRVSTLAAMAVAAGPVAEGTPIAVCLDARQGELYLGVYRCEADGLPLALQPDALVSPEGLQLDSVYGRMLAVGNGWTVWPELEARNKPLLVDCKPDVWPDALSVLQIARRQFVRGLTVTPEEAIPNYVRDRVTQ